eukprot:COSAG05_NODE_3943_length_1762_cov_1.286831_2_plen_467_part_01
MTEGNDSGANLILLVGHMAVQDMELKVLGALRDLARQYLASTHPAAALTDSNTGTKAAPKDAAVIDQGLTPEAAVQLCSRAGMLQNVAVVCDVLSFRVHPSLWRANSARSIYNMCMGLPVRKMPQLKGKNSGGVPVARNGSGNNGDTHSAAPPLATALSDALRLIGASVTRSFADMQTLVPELEQNIFCVSCTADAVARGKNAFDARGECLRLHLECLIPTRLILSADGGRRGGSDKQQSMAPESWRAHGDGVLEASVDAGGLQCQLTGRRGCLVETTLCAPITQQQRFVEWAMARSAGSDVRVRIAVRISPGTGHMDQIPNSSFVTATAEEQAEWWVSADASYPSMLQSLGGWDFKSAELLGSNGRWLRCLPGAMPDGRCKETSIALRQRFREGVIIDRVGWFVDAPRHNFGRKRGVGGGVDDDNCGGQQNVALASITIDFRQFRVGSVVEATPSVPMLGKLTELL